MDEAPLQYVCARCGRVLEHHEYGGCPECGHRGRRRLNEAADIRTGHAHVVPPEAPDWTDWAEWFGGSPNEAPAGPDPKLGSLPREGYVSRRLYIGAYLAGLGVMALGVALVVVQLRAAPQAVVPLGPQLALALAALGATVAVVFPAWLLHVAWKVIQDGSARLTPERAVIGCLIPLYNLYGIPIAVAGFAADFNRFAMRHEISPFRAATGLYEVFSACCVASIVPCVAPVTVTAVLYLTVPLITDLCYAINAVADAQARLDAGAGDEPDESIDHAPARIV